MRAPGVPPQRRAAFGFRPDTLLVKKKYLHRGFGESRLERGDVRKREEVLGLYPGGIRELKNRRKINLAQTAVTAGCGSVLANQRAVFVLASLRSKSTPCLAL